MLAQGIGFVETEKLSNVSEGSPRNKRKFLKPIGDLLVAVADSETINIFELKDLNFSVILKLYDTKSQRINEGMEIVANDKPRDENANNSKIGERMMLDVEVASRINSRLI